MEKSKIMHLLLGPELLWLLIFFAVALLAKANVPPTKSMDDFLVNLAYFVPLLALLTFALWYVPSVEKNWLLLRVWIACIIGGLYALEKGLTAHSEQGPGIGMAFIMGATYLFIALIAGTIFVKIKS